MSDMLVAAPAVTPGMDSTQILLTLVVAVVMSSALAALLTGWLNRRKISSEAENIQAQTSDLIWKRVKGELQDMQVQIDELREQNAGLSADAAEQKREITDQKRELQDVTRLARIAFAHIELMYDLWPRHLAPAPPIPHDLVGHLPTTIVEDPSIPPAPPRVEQVTTQANPLTGETAGP